MLAIEVYRAGVENNPFNVHRLGRVLRQQAREQHRLAA